MSTTGALTFLPQHRSHGTLRLSYPTTGLAIAQSAAARIGEEAGPALIVATLPPEHAALRKDASLDMLAELGNVAQFVSFAPSGPEVVLQFSRVAGYPPNHRFGDAEAAITAVLASAADRHLPAPRRR